MMEEPMIRKASEDEKKSILNVLMGEKQDPKTCLHRMISSHDKSSCFDGEIALNIGKCLDCGSIIRSFYRLEDWETVTDEEVLNCYYEKRDDWRGYGWYEKE